ncbi:solute carrier family 22 member 5-like [Epinephelus moara]|uniref:solute carrier family 22 member 5-like n=1 Tax=Epinephelus moara TaxID=300413 RepID=UPI00214E4CCD|nr:solute carrier family 22 member 5-like [Epinephelus moara]
MSGGNIKDFDEITSFLGDYGFFQYLIMVMLSLSTITCGYTGTIVVFVSDTPEHHCRVSGNSTHNGTDVEQSSWIGPDSCSRYKVHGNWTETARPSNDTEPCLDGWVFSRERYTATIVSEWDLVCDSAWKVPFSTSLFFVGVLIGSFISGHLSDRYITSLVLGSEILRSRARISFSLLGHSLGFGFGYALLPLFAFLIRGWRMLLVASAIPGFLFIPAWWVIPESPRWLLQKGRLEEAEMVIRTAAKRNGVPAPEIIFRTDECMELTKTKDEEEHTYSFLDLIRTPNMRNITILSVIIWMSTSMVFYGLSLNTSNLNGNAYLNCFISAAIDMLTYIATWVLVNRVSQPTLLFSMLTFCGIMLLVIMLLPEDMQVMLQVLALVGKIGVSAAYCLIYVFFTELIPTVVRNMGLGVASTAARIGSIICPYVIYMGEYSKILPYIVFGAVSIMAATVSMLLPDTRNSKLPDLTSQARPIRGCCCPKETAEAQSDATVKA